MAKCKFCGTEHKTKEMVKVADRAYVCDETCKAQYLTHGETKSARTRLFDYINETWEDISFPLVAAQIKQLQDNYGFKIEGMLYTLQYCFEVEDKSREKQYGVKYVMEKYYDEAKEFYLDSVKRQKDLESIEQEQVITCRGNDQQRKLSEFKRKIKGVLD